LPPSSASKYRKVLQKLKPQPEGKSHQKKHKQEQQEQEPKIEDVEFDVVGNGSSNQMTNSMSSSSITTNQNILSETPQNSSDSKHHHSSSSSSSSPYSKVNIDWDSSHIAVSSMMNNLDNTPFRLEQKDWAQPEQIVDLHGNPIVGHLYGHIVKELPQQKAMPQDVESMNDDNVARGEIRGRLSSFLTAVATTTQCSLGKSTEACAWWRLDAEDSPQRSQMESPQKVNQRAKHASNQLKELLSHDVYDMTSHSRLHSMVTVHAELAQDDKAAFQQASNLMIVAKRDAMTMVAKQADNKEALKLLMMRSNQRNSQAKLRRILMEEESQQPQQQTRKTKKM